MCVHDVCAQVWLYMFQGVHVEVREQILGVCSLFVWNIDTELELKGSDFWGKYFTVERWYPSKNFKELSSQILFRVLKFKIVLTVYCKCFCCSRLSNTAAHPYWNTSSLQSPSFVCIWLGKLVVTGHSQNKFISWKYNYTGQSKHWPKPNAVVFPCPIK